MTCNRVVIMYEGKILAADTPENLQQLMSSNSQVIAEIAAPPAELRECWAQMAGDRAVRRLAERGRVFPLRADAAGRPGFAARRSSRWRASAAGRCAS